ncbi:ABC-2 type transporter [Candidatus Vecturithrix granuli]|uniref:Transport permease protein n=1 Tax=Vecturithrix granuli TaxID=1499967 RepID=A0A081BW81_VECG1|nr:ABC-2 type transporter [Candidatus Vecturithrix granuli]
MVILSRIYAYIENFYLYLRLIFVQRYLICSMAKREVETQYIGSVLGFIWAFVQPVVMITLYWVIFSVGFKVQPKNDVPFVVWLTAGMTSWYIFADIVNGSSGIILVHAHLIKKTLFYPNILPVIKILSSLITHAIFLVVLIGLILLQKMPVSGYYLQFLYYLACLCVLALGLSWAVSALNVFIRDVGQIVNVILQIGFWITPIFWDLQMMPPQIRIFFKLNPMFYIVQGYRESFIYFLPFWKHPYQTLYFWIVAAFTMFAGALIFKKLKPHFADVL